MFVLGVIALAALAIVLNVAYRWTRQAPPTIVSSTSRNMKIARLTVLALPIKQRFRLMVNTWSMLRGETGQQSLRVRQVNTHSDVQIVPPSDVQYAGLTFTGRRFHLLRGH